MASIGLLWTSAVSGNSGQPPNEAPEESLEEFEERLNSPWNMTNKEEEEFYGCLLVIFAPFVALAVVGAVFAALVRVIGG